MGNVGLPYEGLKVNIFQPLLLRFSPFLKNPTRVSKLYGLAILNHRSSPLIHNPEIAWNNFWCLLLSCGNSGFLKDRKKQGVPAETRETAEWKETQETQLSNLCPKTCCGFYLMKASEWFQRSPHSTCAAYKQKLATHTWAIKSLNTIRGSLFCYDIKINILLRKFYATIWCFDMRLITIQLPLYCNALK